MLVLVIYLIGVLDNAIFITILSLIVELIILGCYIFVKALDNSNPFTKSFFKIFPAKTTLFLILSVVILPKEDTAYKMLAAYGVTEAYEVVSESEDVKSIASKSLQLLEKTLDKHIEDKG